MDTGIFICTSGMGLVEMNIQRRFKCRRPWDTVRTCPCRALKTKVKSCAEEGEGGWELDPSELE